MMYVVKLGKQALKDREKVIEARLSNKVKILIDVLKKNPYQNPPPYEKLAGDLKGFYSRRINHKHRLVYTIHEEEKIVAIRNMWTHYE